MSIYQLDQWRPEVHPSAFVADSAQVIGQVSLGAEASVWFGCVIRGDVCEIRIGARTNIQDGTVIHVTRKTGPTRIGSGSVRWKQWPSSLGLCAM